MAIVNSFPATSSAPRPAWPAEQGQETPLATVSAAVDSSCRDYFNFQNGAFQVLDGERKVKATQGPLTIEHSLQESLRFRKVDGLQKPHRRGYSDNLIDQVFHTCSRMMAQGLRPPAKYSGNVSVVSSRACPQVWQKAG